MNTKYLTLHEEHLLAIRKYRENPMRLAMEKLLEGVTDPDERSRVRFEYRIANQFWG